MQHEPITDEQAKNAFCDAMNLMAPYLARIDKDRQTIEGLRKALVFARQSLLLLDDMEAVAKCDEALGVAGTPKDTTGSVEAGLRTADEMKAANGW